MGKMVYQLGRICNPPALSMSICNAKYHFFRIKNPYIHSGWITNPAERESMGKFSFLFDFERF